jgi:H/ACA ribonucleoprotein complex subunit 3
MKLTINGATLDTSRLTLLGVGGEAEVYTTPTGQALKVFKGKTHADYQGNPHAAKGAEDRIKLHQQKLSLFPKGLPNNVIAPIDLAYDPTKKIVGYTMKLLSHQERLWSYSQPTIISTGVTGAQLLELFTNMHTTVEAVHQQKVILGDFNDLNILVENHTKPWFIDADSYQFDKFNCMTFDERFVDPLKCILAKPDTHPQLCPDGRSHIMLSQAHTYDSDWYAFSVMLFQSLLLVGPYGGVYRPSGKQANVLPNHLRPLSNITVFNKDVIYPKKARPFGILPDDLLHYFSKLFESNMRGTFPASLIHNTRFTNCTACGTMHARSVCPNCNTFSLEHRVTEKILGAVTAKKMFATSGTILKTVIEHDGLKILYYENGTYFRENKRAIKTAPLTPMKYRISGNRTFMSHSDKIDIYHADNTVKNIFTDIAYHVPTFDANSDHVIWTQNNKLYRDRTILGALTPDVIGNVLSGQTSCWVGEQKGFGFYRAGELQRFFIFDPNKGTGILDSVPVPPIRGQLIDSTCAISSKFIWFFTTTVENSERKNRAFLISHDGKLVGQAETLVDDNSWLGTIRGNLAMGNLLFVPTDNGIVRVELVGGTLHPTKSFPDTAEFVDSSSELFAGTGCIIARRGKTIWSLTIR